MQFLTQATESNAPLTAMQITMCDNAAAAYNLAYKMLAKGDDKLANDYYQRGAALMTNAKDLGNNNQNAVLRRIMSKRVYDEN